MIDVREPDRSYGGLVRLLPKNSEYTWAIYSVLYFGFFFIDPIESHASGLVWFFTLLATAVFLALYFGLFWVSCRQGLLHLAAMVAMGVAFAKYNGGATTFFIFAAACGPFVVDNEVDGFKILTGIEAAGALTWWVFHLNGWFLLFANGLAFVIGISNIHFAQRNRTNRKLLKAQEEIEQLAKVAERERIARDLHDVLGHTLSVIILKSELAGKLMDRDPQRAGNEIREVEQISRQALSEVRDAIRGYRSQGLAAEMAQAKATLETAGLSVLCEVAKITLPPLHETVLSMAVKEGVTNVVRHAHARTCSLRLEQQNGSCRLAIEDDGRGGFKNEGNGLRGMRERVEMLGGTLTRDSQAGTKLTISIPLKQKPLNIEVSPS
ncbi:MAG: sensor histidine kinase [Candidatus Sulfotelmatobacter sp.]|jgi:two-component system sensor histidine kinase DesK